MADWRNAFNLQGTSDFDVFEHLRGRTEIPSCHYLHFLQMATEKLAKGFSSTDGLNEPPKVHHGFTKWLHTLKATPPHSKLLTLCSCKNARQFRAYIHSIENLAEQVENLAPALASQKGTLVNPEYPWSGTSGNIEVPAQYSFSDLNFRDPSYASKTNKFRLLIKAFVRFGRM